MLEWWFFTFVGWVLAIAVSVAAYRWWSILGNYRIRCEYLHKALRHRDAIIRQMHRSQYDPWQEWEEPTLIDPPIEK